MAGRVALREPLPCLPARVIATAPASTSIAPRLRMGLREKLSAHFAPATLSKRRQRQLRVPSAEYVPAVEARRERERYNLYDAFCQCETRRVSDQPILGFVAVWHSL